MKHLWFWLGGCGVCSTLIMMWHAAGSEAKVAPQVLKTILLILKGKPGEMEECVMEKRRFSIDTTNMMPVAVSDAESSWPGNRHLPSHPVLLWFIHSPSTYLWNLTLCYSLFVTLPVRADERHRHRTEKYAMCQMTGSLKDMQSVVGDRQCYRGGSSELLRVGLSAELMSNRRPEWGEEVALVDIRPADLDREKGQCCGDASSARMPLGDKGRTENLGRIEQGRQ